MLLGENMDFFDLHCDTPYECYTKKQGFYVNQLSVSADQSCCFGKWVQTFAFWIRDDLEKPYELYKKMLLDFKSKTKDAPKNLIPCFAVEGGAVLEADSDRLYELKDDGIRLLTLTWNGENLIAGGSKTDKGLTEFGKRVIEKMNRLKIGGDLSHLNEKSFFSAIQIAEFPLATHSNCRKIFNHPRNLTDEQIRLVAEKNGLIGICFYPEFLGCNVFEKIYENIFHIADMGFEDCIAIGSDFDGAEMDKRLKRPSDVPLLYDFLRDKGISRRILSKIFYGNAHNYIANLK